MELRPPRAGDRTTPQRAPSRSTPDDGAGGGRNDDPIGIRHEGIEQLDLHADDRMEAGLTSRTDKANRAIQAAVIRHGQPVQTEFEGPLDQFVGRRRTIEK